MYNVPVDVEQFACPCPFVVVVADVDNDNCNELAVCCVFFFGHLALEPANCNNRQTERKFASFSLRAKRQLYFVVLLFGENNLQSAEQSVS